MGRHLVSLLCILLIFAGLSVSNGYVSNLGVSKSSLKSLIGNDFNGTATRSLMSHPDEHETALVAALNGTIYLMDPKSRKILWSFTSGPLIYSSYHAPLNPDSDKENASGPGCSYFIDCGDDWDMYIHNKLGKVKLQMSIQEYIRMTPHITEDGQFLVGSRESTLFVIDPKTGRLIHSSSPDSPPSSQSNEETNAFNSTATEETGHMNLKTDELLLYISRTDYTLIHLDRHKSVLWNVTVADIGADFVCQDVESSFGPLDLGYELPYEPGTDFNMSLPCPSKPVVYRFRHHNMLESFSS